VLYEQTSVVLESELYEAHKMTLVSQLLAVGQFHHLLIPVAGGLVVDPGSAGVCAQI
jgi:hypothetical protein